MNTNIATSSSNINPHNVYGTGANNNNNNYNKEHDRFLPIANVGRIMKKVIPGNGKISKDAKETVQECVSEFISFVTGEASNKCQIEKRKTINGDDILWAIMTLGFEDYVNPLKLYLNRYREVEGEKMITPKQQRMQQCLQQNEQQQKPNVPYNASSVYSSTNLICQPPFVSTDPPFPFPFSQNLTQNSPVPQQEHIDSVGHW
ncbi:nuclear transcription factor Y subunit B-7 [Olea europaea subsp. europaea]|uniref:Nuclear transcription factor Y subunit B-7 n=1 Tax=Olea europaea subsp. europaea TaxID=158383 RepID=A0A8S0QAF8_OLEEU|nr:nuclear transcription factor Y subunit B-7 [Olea europaea subsp. europaea]